MSNYKESELKKVIGEIAKKNNFANDPNVEICPAIGLGDGYMTESLEITIKNKSPTKELKLLAKVSIKDEESRKAIPIGVCYQNEIFAYENVIPTLQKLQQDTNVPRPFNSFPKFYGASKTDNDEYIITEYLKSSGFEVTGLKQLFNHELLKYTLQKYGQFHALSFALKAIHPDKFKTFKKELKGASYTVCGTAMGEMLKEIVVDIRETMKRKGYESSLLNNHADNFSTLMKEMTNNGEDAYTCFLNGDSWSNNLMFKYGNGKELEEVKFVDWLACSVGPPMFDLSYLIYSGATKDVFENLESYLKIYHESLSNFLTYFKLDSKKIYPLEELKRQWKKYFHFGAIMAVLLWKQRSMAEDGSENYDQEYLFEHTKTLYEHLKKIATLNW